MFCYIAKKDTLFSDGSAHFAGRCYFSEPTTEAYFEVMAEDYDKDEVVEIKVAGRTFAAPQS